MSKFDPRHLSSKQKFLLRNLFKGLLWFSLIIFIYLYIKKHYGLSLEVILGASYDRPVIVYSIFLVSEVVFGIIPPEFFMIWSLRSQVLLCYLENIIALSTVSYLSGVIGFMFGQYLNGTPLYRLFKKRVFGKFERHLNSYGGYVVIVSALTPVPFSGIAMLVGSVQFSLKKYLLFSLTRFARFLVYSFIVWEAHIV